MHTPGRHRPDGREIEELPTAESWRLIETVNVGRLAVVHRDGAPDVFPLNYLAHEGRLYVRSAPGSKLLSIRANPAVALEADGEEDGFHWSVVVRGTAARVEADSEIQKSGAWHLISDAPDRKPHVIRILPATITGRRFPKRPGDAEHSEPQHGVVPADAPGKPYAIPHFPPPWQV